MAHVDKFGGATGLAAQHHVGGVDVVVQQYPRTLVQVLQALQHLDENLDGSFLLEFILFLALEHFAQEFSTEVGCHQVSAFAGLVIIYTVGDIAHDILVLQLSAGGDFGHLTIVYQLVGRVLEAVNLQEVGIAALVLDTVALGIGVFLDEVNDMPAVIDGLSLFEYHISVSGFWFLVGCFFLKKSYQSTRGVRLSRSRASMAPM